MVEGNGVTICFPLLVLYLLLYHPVQKRGRNNHCHTYRNQWLQKCF